MNDYELNQLEVFEYIGSGCCNPDVYTDDCSKCGECEYAGDCGEYKSVISFDGL